MAMELEQQREVAARLRELRGPKTQPYMADQVGVTLRAYQEWEAGGGIKWANLQRLAEIHGVSEDYLLYGEQARQGPQTQLDRIETVLAENQAMMRDLLVFATERALGDVPPPDEKPAAGGGRGARASEGKG